MSDLQSAQQRAHRQKIERQLDEALAATFPASDPVSIVTSHEEEDWGADAAAPEAPATPGTPGRA